MPIPNTFALFRASGMSISGTACPRLTSALANLVKFQFIRNHRVGLSRPERFSHAFRFRRLNQPFAREREGSGSSLAFRCGLTTVCPLSPALAEPLPCRSLVGQVVI